MKDLLFLNDLLSCILCILSIWYYGMYIIIQPTVIVTSPTPSLVSINWYFEDRNDCVHTVCRWNQHISIMRIFYSVQSATNPAAHTNEHAWIKISMNHILPLGNSNFLIGQASYERQGPFSVFKLHLHKPFHLVSCFSTAGWCLWEPPPGPMIPSRLWPQARYAFTLPTESDCCFFNPKLQLCHYWMGNHELFRLLHLHGYLKRLSGTGPTGLNSQPAMCSWREKTFIQNRVELPMQVHHIFIQRRRKQNYKFNVWHSKETSTVFQDLQEMCLVQMSCKYIHLMRYSKNDKL